MKNNKLIKYHKQKSKDVLLQQIFVLIFTFLFTCSLATLCYAASDADTFFDTFLTELFGWVKKAGMLIAAFGGIKLAMGMHSQTEEEKIGGIRTFIAGALVFVIGATPSMFGLTLS